MTLQQICNLAIKMGIKSDLRGEAQVKKSLLRLKEEFERLDERTRQEFDQERLSNPYSDTRILVEAKKPIKKILAGIDISGAELYLAERFKVDLVLSHHPLGKALAGIDEVMDLQIEVFEKYGVPVNVAEGLMKKRISEVARSVSVSNHNKMVDALRLLGISLLCVHTPCDNLVASYLEGQIKNKKFERVFEILEFLKSIPEYKKAMEQKAGPKLFAGAPENRCGKIALTEITGGTEGSPKIYERLSQAGIGTVIGMHLSEKHKKQAEAAHINAIVAGHISSDSIGMNLFLDELEKKGIKVISCSGLIRIKRFKK